MSPARLRWGLILIQIGVLVLLRNTGVLNDNFWIALLVYSPFLLIAIGIEKIFAKSKFKVISYLSVVAIFVGGLYVAFDTSWGGEETSFFSQTTFQKEYLPEIKTVNATLELDNTDLTIRDSGDDLVYGRFDEFTRKPKIDYDYTDDSFTVKLIGRANSLLGGAIRIDTDEIQDWYLKFCNKVPLDLDCTGDNSDLHLNLSTTPLRNLKVEANDAVIYIKLGKLEPLVHVFVDGSDSRLRLRVPNETGIKVTGDEYGSYLKQIGFEESDGVYTNSGYDTLQTKYEIDLEPKLTDFSLDYF